MTKHRAHSWLPALLGGTILWALVGGPLASSWAQGTRFGQYRVGLTVTPRRLPADDQTLARLRVDVRDSAGVAAPDGTLVVVHTDLGYLTTDRSDRSSTASLTTRGGFVSLWAVSDQPGIAVLTVTVQDSRQQGTVEFAPPGDTRVEEARIVHLTGSWTGYALDLGLAEARGDATARFGKLRLEGADYLQLDAEGMVLRGGPGTLTNGEQSISGSDFYLELNTKRGVVRRLTEEGVDREVFDLYTLKPRETDWEAPRQAFTPDAEDGVAWVLADEVIVFGQEKVVVRGGALYSERSKIMDLPAIYIVALPGYSGASNSQVLSFNSAGSVSVSVPYFVGADDHSTTALRLERGTQASRVGAPRDWSLGLSHEYRLGEIAGNLSLSGLPLTDWGVDWRDSRALGDGQADLNLSLPDHRSLFLDGSFYRWNEDHSFNLRTYYARPVDFEDYWGVTGDWLTDPRPLGKGSPVNYRLGTSLGVEKSLLYASGEPEFVNDLYGYLDWSPYRLGPGTRLTPSLSNSYHWDTGGYHSNMLRSELRLDHTFSPLVDLSLRYSASHYSGSVYDPGLRQFLSADLRAYHGTKWMAYLSGSLDLTAGDWYSYATWDYSLTEAWRLVLLGAWYSIDDAVYDDEEVYVGYKLIQNREIGLSWSRQTGEISLELLGLATSF